MKKLFINLLLLLSTVILISQNLSNLNASYNRGHIGDNIGIGYEKNIKKHFVSTNLLYHLNLNYRYNNHTVFKDNFYASTFIEHFGLSFAYKYHFDINNSDINPYFFYNLSVFHNKLRWNGVYTHAGMYQSKELYSKIYYITDPLFAFQNTIGAGIQFPVYKNIDMFAQTGMGFTLILYKNNTRIFC